MKFSYFMNASRMKIDLKRRVEAELNEDGTIKTEYNMPIDAWVVGIDETDSWEFDNFTEPLPEGTKIIGVFAYDKNENTYTAATSPSYYLYPLYAFAVIPDGEVTEKQKDEIDDSWYSTEENYYDVSYIDGIKEYKEHYKEVPVDYASCETDEEKEKLYKEEWETVLEYLRGNHLI